MYLSDFVIFRLLCLPDVEWRTSYCNNKIFVQDIAHVFVPVHETAACGYGGAEEAG